MIRALVHAHPCHSCGARTECTGQLEQDYGAEKDFYCTQFCDRSGKGYQQASAFLCDACADLADTTDHSFDWAV